MRDVNKVILLGRLGADPIQRHTNAGSTVVHFPVATSWKIKGATSPTHSLQDHSVQNHASSDPTVEAPTESTELASANPGDDRLFAQEGSEDFLDPIENQTTDTTSGGPGNSGSPGNSGNPGNRDEYTYNTQRERTQWHRIVAWGKLGEICFKYLRKGQPVYLEGSIRSHRYTGRDGLSRMNFEVHLDDISFLGKPKQEIAEVEEDEDTRSISASQ